MAGATTPDNIPYLTIVDNVIDAGYTAGLATAVQNALDGRALHAYRWVNAGARTAQAGMVRADVGFQEDTEVLYRYNGTAWIAWESAWKSYTPTFSNLTVGSGALTARWRYMGGVVYVDGAFTYGAGSSIGANPAIQHPVTAAPPHSVRFFPLGDMTFLDTGVNAYRGAIHATSSTFCEFAAINAASTFTTYQVVSSTIPFTTATSDVWLWQYSYQPA